MSLAKKIAYSFGAIAQTLSYQAFAAYILFFYVDHMKLNPLLAAVAMVIYAVWNAFNDPLAGYLSDRTRTKWGRRIPYIMFGAVPFGLVYFLLWSPPFSQDNMIFLFIYFLLFICLFDACYSFVIINWFSLFPEMFGSLKERARVNSIRQVFGIVGLIVGLSLPPILYSSIGWPSMGAIFGLIITVSLFIALFGSKEKKEFSLDKSLGLIPAVKFTLKNRSFLIFVSSNLFIQYALTVVLAMFPFYAKYILDLGPRETSFVFLAALVFEMPTLFVWAMAATRFGAKNVYMAAIASFACFLFPFFFVSSNISAFITAAFLGTALAGVIVLSDVLISQVIDEDELRTKTRREGTYFGVNAFVTRFAIALEAASIGGIFFLTKYNPRISIQPGAFLVGLRILMAGLPMLAMASAFILMIYYPIYGERLKKLSSDVDALHREKKALM